MTIKSAPKLRFHGFSDRWSVSLLKQLAKVGTGSRDTKDRVTRGAYPFFVRSDQVERINSYSYNGAAILTSGDGVGVGKNFHYIEGRFDYHQRVYAVRDFSPKVDSKYVYQYFAEKFYRRVMRVSAKNSVDSVRMEMISDMPIPYPGRVEQEKIADFLVLTDSKISSLQKKIEFLQKYKKSAMQTIFSQKIRFRNQNGNRYSNWKTKKLGDLFDRITDRNEGNNRNVLTISAQQGLVNQQDYFNKSIAAQDITGYYLLQHGDFTYNKSYSNGYPMGAIKRLNNYDTGVVSTLYICFRVKQKQYATFFEHVFDAGLQNRAIEKVAQEGARNHGLLNITAHDFFSIEFTVPGEEEQQRIANFLSSLDHKINLAGRGLKQAKQFKKALLQQMFV